MIIQKISKNLKNDKLISLCSNVPFIFECFQDEKQTHWHEKPTWKHWTAKLPKLCDSFTMVLHKTAAFYTEQCTSPSLFHNFQVSQGSSNQSLKNYGFISNTIFKNCRHMHKSLSNKAIIIQDCWITKNQWCAWRHGKTGINCWLCVWRAPAQLMFLQPILHTSTEEAYEDGLAALW